MNNQASNNNKKEKGRVMDTEKNKDGEMIGEEQLDESIKRFNEENRRAIKIEARPGTVTINPPPSKS